MIELGSVQELIDSGLAWELEGMVGRACMDAIKAGAAMLPPVPQYDHWGNLIPSRDQVVPGTVGSPEFVAAHEEDES